MSGGLPARSGAGSGTAVGAADAPRSRSARRHQIPTGLHANLSEGRPVGPARHGASSLIGSEGFFLGKMGFRRAVAAGEVILAQVRRCGCRKTLRAAPRRCPGPLRGGTGAPDGSLVQTQGRSQRSARTGSPGELLPNVY